MNYQGIGRYPDKVKLKADEKRLIEKVVKTRGNFYLTPLTLRPLTKSLTIFSCSEPSLSI